MAEKPGAVLVTALKRRRKHLPLIEPYSQEEAAAIGALAALEEAAGQLLGVRGTAERNGPTAPT